MIIFLSAAAVLSILLYTAAVTMQVQYLHEIIGEQRLEIRRLTAALTMKNSETTLPGIAYQSTAPEADERSELQRLDDVMEPRSTPKPLGL